VGGVLRHAGACTFDLGCEHDNYHELFRYVEIDDGDLDYYLMSGNSPAEVIAQFVDWWAAPICHRAGPGLRADRHGTGRRARRTRPARQFHHPHCGRRHSLFGFHYGSGYSSRGKRRYVFTWNTEQVPGPEGAEPAFSCGGMHLVANIKPCLLDDHPAYSELKAMGGLIEDKDSHAPVVEQFWDGVGSHVDFTHPGAIDWWQQRLGNRCLTLASMWAGTTTTNTR
jgi:alpha-glucosidase